ncbi:MAG: hypothetical protein PHI81_06160, partial [Synergistaceae bacterium]|nr:hypothetical protein [Synergistaceae bacterium]
MSFFPETTLRESLLFVIWSIISLQKQYPEDMIYYGKQNGQVQLFRGGSDIEACLEVFSPRYRRN